MEQGSGRELDVVGYSRFDLHIALVALTKCKHIVLFGIFFLMTYAQVALWATLATMVMGVLIELEEGATGTGYCHLHDLLPDAAGALLGAVIATMWTRAKGRRAATAEPTPGGAPGP